MDYEQIFDLSFERCRGIKARPPFFESFYYRYLNTDPRIASIFRNTDIQHQQKMLEKSFYRLLTFYATNNSDDYMESIASSHSRQHHNIAPELYDLWLDTLLETVEQFDPLFDDTIELAWRLILSSGITYMKFKYDH